LWPFIPIHDFELKSLSYNFNILVGLISLDFCFIPFLLPHFRASVEHDIIYSFIEQEPFLYGVNSTQFVYSVLLKKQIYYAAPFIWIY